MTRLVVCMDCPNYQKGGYCTHKRKDVSALAPACDYAKTINQEFNPEDTDEPMTKPLAPQAQTKTCTKCGRELPISEFYAKAGSKDGLQTQCKECHNAATRKSIEKRKADNIFNGPGIKSCPRCGQDLPKEAFGKNARTRDGLQPYCKKCRSEARKGKTSRPGRETATKYTKTAQDQPKAGVVVRETLTDKQMVDLLREHGWTVTCYRTITEEL